ncbi:MAG: aldo/keto reductase [Cyclobacteriaceae bacterium]|nr:aldo/keto reductase [Cyclobacteriaceae bacterium]
MKYRLLGRTGLRVSEIGFGAWAIGSNWGRQSISDSVEALNKAIDMGLNFIDTALGYGNGKSEQIIAEVLKERREKVIVATKIPPVEGPWPPSPYCSSSDRYPETYIRNAIDTCRKNLDTDSIDILQLHTWTRAWNRNPRPLDILHKLKEEGVIRHIGLSTPEQDQNALIFLMREGYLDTVQLIYNIFEQEPAAELLPVALDKNIGVIVRVALDEGILTGKYKSGHLFPKDDFRSKYFEGDRMPRALHRVELIKKELEHTDFTIAQAALKFVLAHPAVSTVITGIRNKNQATQNMKTTDIPDLPDDLMIKLRGHVWRRGIWYSGK